MTTPPRPQSEIDVLEQEALEDARSIARQSRERGNLQPWIEVLEISLEGRYPDTEVLVILRNDRRDAVEPLRLPVWAQGERTQSGRPEVTWDPRSFDLMLMEAE